ncbi:ctr86p [Saccharomyces arboricola H-6]|uniref:Ataxin-10 homolog n=1 Tax=Saccharomyces arboricola (strain H-6 / AS 2.3317 / CBS 10644) TaxID=1160507 RepID=J8QA78_SACAR|nr:ctr86p [Saccharomyces arboricola H-6]
MSAENFSDEFNLLDSIDATTTNDPHRIEHYGPIVENLNQIFQRTFNDENHRKSMADCQVFWERLRGTLEGMLIPVPLNEKSSIPYTRIMRGLILLMRNLAAENQEIPQKLLLQNLVIRCFLHTTSEFVIDTPLIKHLYIASLTCIYNMQQNHCTVDMSTFPALLQFFQYPYGIEFENGEGEEHFWLPYLFLFRIYLNNDEFSNAFFRDNETSQDDYYCLRDRIVFDIITTKFIRDQEDSFVVENGRSYLDDSKLKVTSTDLSVLDCISKSLTSASFGKYLRGLEDREPANFTKLLQILQLITTSKEDWNKYELTAIMSWCYPIIQRLESNDIPAFFKKGVNDYAPTVAIQLHSTLLSCLDIISDLCKFDHVRKFLISYDSVKTFISLLDIFQKNLLRINFLKGDGGTASDIKITDYQGNKIEDRLLIFNRVNANSFFIRADNFPNCKLVIIEILASLVYAHPEIQDQIRELGGLALILSNCVIDDNDPFIKERSIVCLKFLLKNNAKNQEFVKIMEAQDVVQDDALSKAGFEISVEKGGKVRLVSKKGDSENEISEIISVDED